MRRILLIASLAAGAVTQAAAQPQPYPAKAVKIIVPAQPGGGLDLIGRTVAQELSRSMKQSFVVENQSGGGGTIAAQAAARAAPDGYTLMVGYVATHATNPAVRKVPYDAVKDFTPIAMVGGTPNVLVVRPSVPVEDVKGLVEYIKKNPGKLSYGSGGIGTLNHLLWEEFRAAAGIDVVVAHYRGIGPAFTDFLGGQVQLMTPGLAAAMPHLRTGKLKVVAITGTQRHPLVPAVPTFREASFPGFESSVQWYGIVGPAKLPAEITARLNGEINRAIRAPALRERLSAEAIDPMPMTPAQFGKFIQSEIAHWGEVARERHISLDD